MPRRLFALVTVAGLVVLAVVGLSEHGPVATAQEGTPVLQADTLIGAWLLTTNPRDPTNPLSVAIFNRDGTYHESDADGSNGAGTWQATGPQTAILTIVYPQQTAQGQAAGIVRIRAAITVAADGASFTAPYTLEIVDAAGTSTGQLGPGMATATRITAEAPGTPVGPIPSGTPPAGTPTS